MHFWPPTVEGRACLSLQGRRSYRVEAGRDSLWAFSTKIRNPVLIPVLEPHWVSSAVGHCSAIDDVSKLEALDLPGNGDRKPAS